MSVLTRIWREPRGYWHFRRGLLPYMVFSDARSTESAAAMIQIQRVAAVWSGVVPIQLMRLT
jgi:hypothetical protein